jgi:hypothetical protein
MIDSTFMYQELIQKLDVTDHAVAPVVS